MSDISEDEVLRVREEAIKYIINKYSKNVTFIDNYHHTNLSDDANNITHLGESIKQLSKADAIYFCDGWKDSRGCVIEREIADKYFIKILT